MNSQKALKEFWHLDIKPDEYGAIPHLDASYEDGWETFAPPVWDATEKVWRVIVWRDKEASAPAPITPTPKPTLISEATPITPPASVTEQPIVPSAPVPSSPTDQPEAESVDETNTESPPPKVDEQPVIIVMPSLYPPMDFETEMRRIRADKSLSPMEKTEAIKKAGDEIALAKARIAGEQAWDIWNRMYPVTKPSFLLPAEVEA